MLKKLVIAASFILFSFSHAFASAQDYVFNAPGPNFLVNFNTQASYHGICIGGEICGKSTGLKIVYPMGSWVNAIEVGCHDKVGDKYKAHLQVYVNGNLVGEQDVKKDGSTLHFPVSAFAAEIRLVSVNEDHNSGGDETDILQLYSY